MAISEKILAAEFNEEDIKPIDHYTYVFLGDGCLMEGVSHEACSFAGTHNLGKLICFYDQNGISIDGEIEHWFTDDSIKRFNSYGWHTISVDGHNVEEIEKAIEEAKMESDKPSMIFCKTTIGFGSPNKSGTADVHGAPLGEEEINKTREALGWTYEPFELPEDVYEFWNATEQGSSLNLDWDNLMSSYEEKYPEKSKELNRRINADLPQSFENDFDKFLAECDKNNSAMATRKASKACLDFFVKEMPELIGGSADLTPSNNTFSASSSTFSNENPSGNHINYGVREFGMSAIMNGMVLHGGIKPYGATFLVFTDYARNAVRLSALMGLPNIFVYTHDSVALGEDGPTHQPIEQIASLRAIPDLDVVRPADANEVSQAWEIAINNSGPTAIILTRQNVPVLEGTDRTGQVAKGAYVLIDAPDPAVVLAGTGSEVQLCVQAAAALAEDGISSRVVSMPSWEIFSRQDPEYRKEVLPADIPVVGVEAGVSFGWDRWADRTVTIDKFGKSAPGDQVMQVMGISAFAIETAARDLLP